MDRSAVLVDRPNIESHRSAGVHARCNRNYGRLLAWSCLGGLDAIRKDIRHFSVLQEGRSTSRTR
jgi:hypothetical protein